MANYQQNRERSSESIDNSTNVGNTDVVHTGTRISNRNTYHYRELTHPSARHQETTVALPEGEIDGHMLLQEQASTKHQQIEFGNSSQNQLCNLGTTD